MRPRPILLDWPEVTAWPRQVLAPERDFFDVLNSRRSRTGGAVGEDSLAALLRHTTMLRTRRLDGRFGEWESRSAPSAGGLHAIRILCLPLERDAPAGLYDQARHALLASGSLVAARRLNKESVLQLSGATSGTTLQLMADRAQYEACYSHPETLAWRDAGALSATAAFVATALGLEGIVLGRHGDDVLEAASLAPTFAAVGAIHLGAR